MKKTKTEMKGSLFVVTLESGCYSDWGIDHYLFSGNDENEVWEFVKIWATENQPSHWMCGLMWGDKKHIYKLEKYGEQITEDEIRWDSGYGDAFDVKIKRAEVIYVNP